MIDEVEILLAKIRKYDPNYIPKSVGKYLLVELQSRHLDHQIKYKKGPSTSIDSRIRLSGIGKRKTHSYK
ncbi:hypothetical protein VFC2026_29950 [Listeria monocytogenes]|uniref:hypothetical protein n=1 Tax=Listeria monocytogenes TaxID=1639 RepID=UPI000A7ABCD8|nr:hypothetical protein [Listeria monocytogenes]